MTAPLRRHPARAGAAFAKTERTRVEATWRLIEHFNEGHGLLSFEAERLIPVDSSVIAVGRLGSRGNGHPRAGGRLAFRCRFEGVKIIDVTDIDRETADPFDQDRLDSLASDLTEALVELLFQPGTLLDQGSMRGDPIA